MKAYVGSIGLLFILFISGCGNEKIDKIKSLSLRSRGGSTYGDVFEKYEYCKQGKWITDEYGDIIYYKCVYNKSEFLNSYIDSSFSQADRTKMIFDQDPIILTWKFYAPNKEGAKLGIDIIWKYFGNEDGLGRTYFGEGPAQYIKSFESNEPLPSEALPKREPEAFPKREAIPRAFFN